MRGRHNAMTTGTPTPTRLADASRSLSLSWAEYFSASIAGISIGAAIIMGMHHFSDSANAHALGGSGFTSVAAPTSLLQTKGDPLFSSLAPEQEAPTIEILAPSQEVKRDGKGDPLTRSALGPEPVTPHTDANGRDDIIRADRRPVVAQARLIRTPPVWKLEKSWRLARAERARILAERKKRLRERMCLAKALYFEARGEGMKGQLAVAQVILNRVRDPRFPNTICGVVYQGAERRHACQFSFACDGKPDYPANARQWATARRLAARVLRGKARLKGMEGVAFYHADYVRPQWASMMRPVLRIGRHIFYRDS